jgi:hypothetical protein
MTLTWWSSNCTKRHGSKNWDVKCYNQCWLTKSDQGVGPALSLQTTVLVLSPSHRIIENNLPRGRRRKSLKLGFSTRLRILANMWGSVDPSAPGQTMKGEWRSFVKQMEGKWSRKMLKALLFLAAMLSCQLPLSAVDWAREVFVPVRVSYTG